MPKIVDKNSVENSNKTLVKESNENTENSTTRSVKSIIFILCNILIIQSYKSSQMVCILKKITAIMKIDVN